MGVHAGVCLGEEAWGPVNYICMVDDQIKNWYLRHACILSKLLKGRTYICNVRTPYIIILFGRRAPKKDAFFCIIGSPVSLQHANHKHVRSFSHFMNRSKRAHNPFDFYGIN